MNKAEFKAHLEQECHAVPGDFVLIGAPSQEPGRCADYQIATVQQAEKSTRESRQVLVSVLNDGITEGPLTYQWPVYDQWPPTKENPEPTIIHNVGDPVLDENGEQIVIPPDADPETLESCDFQKGHTLQSPLTATKKALEYLDAKVAEGEFIRYAEAEDDVKRVDLGFFHFYGWVEDMGKVTCKKYFMDTDAQGNARHFEVVEGV